MPVDPNLARRLLVQNARTSELLGVPFVPIAPAARTPHAPARVVEPKPATIQFPDGPSRAVHPPADRAPAAPPTAVSSPAFPPIPDGPPLDRAAAQAALDGLLQRYEHDAPHQHFVTGHTKIVFGDGDPRARLMFIGEAPGADEDRVGIPFVGRAGQLLNKMIVAMGLRREDVYIANVLKTRPPNNATPTIQEAAICAPYLFEQIAIVRPEVIVTLGLPAARVILNDPTSTMSAMRGRWHTFTYQHLAMPVMPTYHPAFLLRSYTVENRTKVWSDLQQVVKRLGLTPNPSQES